MPISIRSVFFAGALALAGAPMAANMAAAQDGEAGLKALDPATKAAVRAEIRAYLLENPELIVEAMQVLEQRRELARAEARKQVLDGLSTREWDKELTFVGGNPDGDVTLIEFVDYNCPACKAFSPAVQTFVDTDKNARYVAVLLPFQGSGAEVAARAALASKKLMPADKHAEFHRDLLNFRGRMNAQVVMKLAKEAGLDTAVLQKAMADPAVTTRIQENLALAQSMSVNGTPTYAIGGEVFNFLRGEDPLARLKTAAATARAKNAAN